MPTMSSSAGCRTAQRWRRSASRRSAAPGRERRTRKRGASERTPVNRSSGLKIDLGSIAGVPAAIAVVLVAQVLEGASAKSLWQPTAALVVFGGTLAAVFVSYPPHLVLRTAIAVREAFVGRSDSAEPVFGRILELA